MTSAPGAAEEISILIIDDDTHGQAALRQILDAEGWRVQIAPLPSQGMEQLARGQWSVVIANISLTGLEGPLFTTLKELSQAPAIEGDTKRVRVLFLLPELVAVHAQRLLEEQRLPYCLKPLNLNDFLDKVGDLLLERGSILAPIRRVKYETDRRRSDRRTKRERRGQPMFASREDYIMTEEEIAEYEKQEKEESAQRQAEQKKRTDLGGSPDED